MKPHIFLAGLTFSHLSHRIVSLKKTFQLAFRIVASSYCTQIFTFSDVISDTKDCMRMLSMIFKNCFSSKNFSTKLAFMIVASSYCTPNFYSFQRLIRHKRVYANAEYDLSELFPLKKLFNKNSIYNFYRYLSYSKF